MVQAALHHLFLFYVHKSMAYFSSLLQDLPLVSNVWITALAAQFIYGLCWVQSSRFWLVNSHMVTKLSVWWTVFGVKMQYSDGNAYNLFQFYNCRRSSEEKAKGRSLSKKNKSLCCLFSVYWSHTRQWETALSFNIFDSTRFIPATVLVLRQMAEYIVRSTKFLFKLLKTVNIHKISFSGGSVLNS